MELSLHTTFPAGLQDAWNRLVDQNHSNVPFLRYGYLETWWQTHGGGEWPDAQLALVTAEEAGRLVGIAPLFYTPNHQGQARLMLLGSIEVSDYLDLIVEQGLLQVFVDALLPFLAGAGLPAWQSLDLYNLFEDSPTLSALESAAQRPGWAQKAERVYHCPAIPLPGDWETYLAGIDKKQRHEVRRKMRRLEAADVPSRWYVVTDESTLDEEMKAFTTLMEQDEDKARFLTPPMRLFMQSVVHWAFSEGLLHLAFLENDGKKAAAYFAFDYQNRLWVYNSGIDRAFLEYSPGWVLLGYQLQWANETGRSAFDFMRGDEEYKYRFGGIDRYLQRLTLTPNRS
jgi:CelD/BcsL family acetyltransferase involved in cellulose biosynthesis